MIEINSGYRQVIDNCRYLLNEMDITGEEKNRYKEIKGE